MDKKIIELAIRWVGKKTTVGGYSERTIEILTDECLQYLDINCYIPNDTNHTDING